MGNLSLAVHRTIVAVDVEGFGDRRRTNRNQLAIRDGLYRAMREAFCQVGIPWADCDHEDRGDGTVRIWNLNVQYPIDRICATARGLTPRRWNQYIPQLPYDPSCVH